jgi:phage shock protein C
MTAPNTPQKRLYRSRDQRMLAGVCGGIADYLGMDPTIVRLVTVLLGIVSFGTALIGYIIAAIIIPEAPAGTAPDTL